MIGANPHKSQVTGGTYDLLATPSSTEQGIDDGRLYDMKVVVCAFGTRGDIQPLAILAAALAEKDWCREVVLVTHREHCSCSNGPSFVQTLLRASCSAATKCTAWAVDSPAVMRNGVHLSEAGQDDAVTSAQQVQQDTCVDACNGAGLILFSLFALEGYHIAEKMQVPCAVCHPYLITVPLPSSFKTRMRRVYPRLFRKLIRPLTTGLSASGGESKCMLDHAEESAMDHVEHWMWPLFTDRWENFRARLGLPLYPLADDETEPLPPPSEDDRDDVLEIRSGNDDARARVSITKWGCLPTVLYLFSELVVDGSPFWPRSVRVCGYVFPPSSVCGKGERNSTQEPAVASTSTNDAQRNRAEVAGASEPVPQEVEKFLCLDENKPAFVDFGSMWAMCPRDYGLAHAFRTVVLGAKQARMRCLVVLPRIESANDREADGDNGKRFVDTRELDAALEFVLGEYVGATGLDGVLVHRGSLAHDIILPRCSLAIHHGGSGTTAAVLRAGIPHVICPQHLDQFFWAERVQHLNVGGVLERSLFLRRGSPQDEPSAALVSKAGSAILRALTPQVKLRAACLGLRIRRENGLVQVVDSIEHIVQASQESPRQSAPVSTAPHVMAETRSRLIAQGLDGEGRASGADSRCHSDRSFVDKKASLEAPERRGVSVLRDTEGCIVEEQLMVRREMRNGMEVWSGKEAEEETFFIYNEIFEDKTYAKMGVRVSEGDTVWDVGANVGLASMFFELSTDTPDSVSIYAFEPAPLNRLALRRNLAEHCPRARIFRYALGAKNEDSVGLTFYPRMPGNSTFKPKEKERLQGGRMGGAREDTLSASLDTEGRGNDASVKNPKGDFFQGEQKVFCNIRTASWLMSTLGVNKIDLLKIDVEGCELDVLLGIEEQHWPKIAQLVVEVHPVADRVARICGLLRNQGFHVYEQVLGLDGTPVTCKREASETGAGFERNTVAIPIAHLPDSGDARTFGNVMSSTTREANILRRRGNSDPDGQEDQIVHGTKGSGVGIPVDEGVSRTREDDANSRIDDGVVYMVYARRM